MEITAVHLHLTLYFVIITTPLSKKSEIRKKEKEKTWLWLGNLGTCNNMTVTCCKIWNHCWEILSMKAKHYLKSWVKLFSKIKSQLILRNKTQKPQKKTPKNRYWRQWSRRQKGMGNHDSWGISSQSHENVCKRIWSIWYVSLFFFILSLLFCCEWHTKKIKIKQWIHLSLCVLNTYNQTVNY